MKFIKLPLRTFRKNVRRKSKEDHGTSVLAVVQQMVCTRNKKETVAVRRDIDRTLAVTLIIMTKDTENITDDILW